MDHITIYQDEDGRLKNNFSVSPENAEDFKAALMAMDQAINSLTNDRKKNDSKLPKT